MKAAGVLVSLLFTLIGAGGCGGRSILLTDAGDTAHQAEDSCSSSALEIAKSTEAVQIFLDAYGSCDGCNPEYAKGVENLIGCVLYEVQDCKGPPACEEATWTVSFWLGEVCSFRHGVSEEKLVVTISKRTCQPTSISPQIDVIREPQFCNSDEDCVCLSGSGVPFIGCRNDFYGPLSPTGSYSCSACRCVGDRCVER
jgi:hypothetical protein